MQHLTVFAAHRDLVAGALGVWIDAGERNKATGFLFCSAFSFALAMTVSVKCTSNRWPCLVTTYLPAVCLPEGPEGELLARHLLLLRANCNIPEARRAASAGGDDGASVAELDLRDRAAARCVNVSVRKCPHTTGLLQLQYVVVFAVYCSALQQKMSAYKWTVTGQTLTGKEDLKWLLTRT